MPRSVRYTPTILSFTLASIRLFAFTLPMPKLAAMAKSKILFSVLLIFTFLFPFILTAKPTSYSRRISPRSLGFHDEKLTHLHFYFHDVVTGPNPTMLIVAEPEGRPKNELPFGTVVTMEDPLTLGPEPDSRLIGKAQGLYTSVSKNDIALMMVMTIAFIEGEFNGSTLSILGLNMIKNPVREMPIIGGTGLFQFVRGFAQANSIMIDWTKGDAIVEYNVYVTHYLTLDSSSPDNFNEGLDYMVDPILAKIKPTIE